MEWLIHDETLRAMAEMRRAGLKPTVEQNEAFAERQLAVDGNPVLNIEGSEAEITVDGVLTENPDFFSFLFGGGTAFRDIRAALASADADPSVKRATMLINSPGGTVEGMFDTIAAINAFSKPLVARASQAASAAFALAAAAGQIEAKTKASEFGSIGVVTTRILFDDEVTLTNTDSPDKRPDPRTEEGKATIVRELDAINDLFVEEIAGGRTRAGRKTTIKDVKENFGRGATLLAEEAKSLGMIDKIAKAQKPVLRAVRRAEDDKPAEVSAIDDNKTPAAGGQETRMDIDKLKAEHRSVYDAIFGLGEEAGKDAGKDAGASAERDRVSAHLVMGEASGDLKTAHQAIKDGAEMTTTLHATYMAASMNKADKTARQTETDAAGKTVDGTAAAGDPKAKDLGDKIMDKIDAGNVSQSL